MDKNKSVKSCLIISYGPVPTPQYQTVEGGGMRVWGLAEGLKENGIDATVAVNDSFPQELSEHDGIRIVNWSLDSNFIKLMNSYDSLIISYCMGDPSTYVVDNINDDVQLILDAYVPIYIEVSARDSKDIETEYTNYIADIGRFNKVLKRGDYFLYANDAQELFYTGVLSALGIINPSSYRETRIVKTPFGIHRTPLQTRNNPYKEIGISDEDFVVLWFGGIYPWFHIEEYLKAINALSKNKQIKFVFVGGKNPFNPNPDFSRQYDLAVSFTKKHNLLNQQVYFVDWVDFNDRVDWFVHCDVIVSINQPGEENKYSWRTRVMDYVWGEAVTISNGGDPLSEELITYGAAIRLKELTSEELVNTINRVKNNRNELKQAKRNLSRLKQKYFWDIVTNEVAKIIKTGDLPYTNEQELRNKIVDIPDHLSPAHEARASKVIYSVGLPAKLARKIRQKGIIRTAKLASSVLKNQVKGKTPLAKQPQFIFISHPINNSGAPIVLIQIIEEYVKRYGSNRVRVIAPGIEKKQNIYLKKLGVSLEHSVFGMGFHFIRLQLNLRPDDFVFMNTTAIYDNYRDFILLWLRNGRLKHAYWFIHEDIAQLPTVHREFLDPRNIAQIADLVKKKSLSLLFPSKRTALEYEDLIGIDISNTINLHVEVDKKYIKPRRESDFDTLNFLISGSASDGRKGQLLALAAFYDFIKNYEEKSPDSYRQFKLHLVAINKEDYVSQQIRWISESLMGDRVVLYESLPKDDALAVTAMCNAVICCSLNETFGLYVAEGMLMGHIVLRNNSAGVDEQLVNGKNGLLIDHTDIQSFAEVIESLLNKVKYSNKKLLDMGKSSQQIISKYRGIDYIDQIEKIN